MDPRMVVDKCHKVSHHQLPTKSSIVLA